MDQWFIVNVDGFFTGKWGVGGNQPSLEEGQRLVKKPWPNGIHKPKHDEETDQWVSGETPKETAAREAEENAPKPPTTDEKVQEQGDKISLLLDENTKLKADNEILKSQNSEIILAMVSNNLL